MLWFDVEKKYKTIAYLKLTSWRRLWFDVEKEYKTIPRNGMCETTSLWFDVEKKYKTIHAAISGHVPRCGLM